MKNLLCSLFAVMLCGFAVLISPAAAQVPNLISYQGRVAVGTVNFNGTGRFKFALVGNSGAATYWSNDNTSVAGGEPTAAVTLAVTNGLYSVLLGDATLPNMTVVPTTVFTNADVRLRVWFDDGTHGSQLLSPDQRIAAVGYAIRAGNAATADTVADGAITAAMLGAGVVGSAQLAPNLSLGGNLTLPLTTASAGAIYAGGQTLLSAFGPTNIFAGGGAGNFAMTGLNNAAVGYQSFSSNTSGSYNVAFGFQALHANTTGIYNTAAGFTALAANTSGFSNTATGAGALPANTIGYQNSAGGDDALNANVSGNNNTASGYAALFLNQTGSNNTATGLGALYSNTGDNNTATGYLALYSNQSGTDNVAAGDQPLYSNASGADNIAFGRQALYHSTGTGNIGIGLEALHEFVSGDYNIGIGALAGTPFGGAYTGSYNIYIGAGTLGVANESGATRIGTPGITSKIFLQGVSTNSVPSAPVYVGNDGQLVSVVSSRRFKKDIEDMGEASDALLALRPVTFHYKTQEPQSDGHYVAQYGLIAEEVNEVCPDLVLRDGKGEIFTVRYEQVNAMLLNEFLKDHRRLTELRTEEETEVETLREENTGLQKRLTEVEFLMKRMSARLKESGPAPGRRRHPGMNERTTMRTAMLRRVPTKKLN